MNTKPVTSIIVLFTLISSGCLGIIDDINDEQLSKRPKWKLTDLGNKILKTSYSLEISENS